MCALVGLWLLAGTHVEAPGLNSLAPIAPSEGQVFNCVTWLEGAGADKISTTAVVIPRLAAVANRCLGRDVGEGRNALRIGRGRGYLASIAGGDANFRVGNGLAFVQRRHPGERVFAPQLEVHAEVGDQGRRAHVHSAGVAIAFIQK